MAEVTCDYCGERFRSSRPSCPHCGSDAQTGWKDDDEIDAASVDLGTMDDEGYEDFLRREGLAEEPTDRPNSGPRWGLALLGILIVIVSVIYILVAAQRR